MVSKAIIPIFVYGTLMRDETRTAICGRVIDTIPAMLEGYRREGLNIVSSEEDNVLGMYFLVTEMELKNLDVYESVDSQFGYHRMFVNVQTADGFKRAYVYQIKGTED